MRHIGVNVYKYLHENWWKYASYSIKSKCCYKCLIFPPSHSMLWWTAIKVAVIQIIPVSSPGLWAGRPIKCSIWLVIESNFRISWVITFLKLNSIFYAWNICRNCSSAWQHAKTASFWISSITIFCILHSIFGIRLKFLAFYQIICRPIFYMILSAIQLVFILLTAALSFFWILWLFTRTLGWKQDYSNTMSLNWYLIVQSGMLWMFWRFIWISQRN